MRGRFWHEGGFGPWGAGFGWGARFRPGPPWARRWFGGPPSLSRMLWMVAAHWRAIRLLVVPALDWRDGLWHTCTPWNAHSL